ncbi:MFS transporter [Methanophagales archaeon]|nr:MAG: MFS transporter [Methanophagales archaeon]
MNRNRYLKGVSANVLLLGVVSFMNDLSSEMIMPILPMFITVLGGAGLILGLIGGLQDSISSILKVLSGHWSDRIGRRKIFVSSGYLTSASFKLLLSLSMIWQHILVFSSFERVGKGLRTAPRDAIIADSMPEARGKGFGIHRALDTSGAIAGSVIVLLLLLFLCFDFEQIAYQIAFYKSIIFIAAIVAFFSLVPLYFVKEGKREPQEMKLQISLKKLPKQLKLFIAVATLFALANFTYMFFIWKAKDAFMPLMPVKEAIALAILLYVLFNVFYAMLAIPFGTLSDRIGRWKVLTFGYFLFSVTCLGFAFFDSLAAFLVLFPLYGAVYAMVDGNQRAFVSDLSTEELRATALGTFHTMIGLVALPASVIAGLLWQVISPNATFIYGSVVSLIAVILFLIFSDYFKDQVRG